MAAEEDGTPPDSPRPSERHGGARSPRPPLTLDLEANLGEREKPADAAQPWTADASTPEREPDVTTGEEPDHAAPPDEHKGTTHGPLATPLAAGIVGGLFIVALGFALQTAGIIPTPHLATTVEQFTANIAAFEQRLSDVEAQQAQANDLSARMDQADALTQSLDQRLRAAESTINQLNEADTQGEAVTQSGIDDLSQRLARLEATVASRRDETTPAPATDQLSERLDHVEQELSALAPRFDELATERAAMIESERAVHAIMLESLRQAATRGGPFAAALANLHKLGIVSEPLTALAPFAEIGAPSRRELVAEFATVADAMLAARTRNGEHDSIVERLSSFARQFVTIRPTQPVEGSDPAAIISRMQAAVSAGNFAAALDERQALPAEVQAVSEAWATKAAARAEIDRLVEALGPGNDVSDGGASAASP